MHGVKYTFDSYDFEGKVKRILHSFWHDLTPAPARRFITMTTDQRPRTIYPPTSLVFDPEAQTRRESRAAGGQTPHSVWTSKEMGIQKSR